MSEKMKAEEKEMMENPSRWPQWPFLPVKRYKGKGFPDCGVLYDNREHLNTVFMINLWDIKGQKQLLDSEKACYPSVDDVLRDGWVVD